MPFRILERWTYSVLTKTGTLTCDKIVLEKYINADGSDDNSKRILRHATSTVISKPV